MVDLVKDMFLAVRLNICIFEQAVIVLILLLAFVIGYVIFNSIIGGLLLILPNNIYYIVFEVLDSIYVVICFL